MSTENKSLVTLVADYQKLISMVMEAEGELTSEIENELAVNAEMLATKADKYDFIMAKLEAEEEYWKDQADRYAKVGRACSNARDRLKTAIKTTMQLMGTTEIKGENASFKLSNSAPKLVLNQALIPQEYIIETVVREPNKDKIKGALKEGKEVPGAQLEPVFALRVGVARKAK